MQRAINAQGEDQEEVVIPPSTVAEPRLGSLCAEARNRVLAERAAQFQAQKRQRNNETQEECEHFDVQEEVTVSRPYACFVPPLLRDRPISLKACHPKGDTDNVLSSIDISRHLRNLSSVHKTPQHPAAKGEKRARGFEEAARDSQLVSAMLAHHAALEDKENQAPRRREDSLGSLAQTGLV